MSIALPRRHLLVLRWLSLAVLLTLLVACGKDQQGENVDPDQVDATELPATNACRNITPLDLSNASNASRIVDCTKTHTAETFLVQALPEQFDDAAYDDRSIGIYASQTCAPAFTEFLGTDESTSMRTIVGWVWFRPSSNAWEDGARWFRCDAVGGTAASTTLAELPPSARGLLAAGPTDRWMACVDAPSVSEAPRIPCDQPHLWRAVTTIKLGNDDAPYPGDKEVVARTKEFCSGSVSAWLGYPPDFDFGYTWFGSASWESGNRRSVCWARTNK